MEVLGKYVVALVTAGYGHYGAGAVPGQHVVRQPDLHGLVVHRVQAIGAREDARDGFGIGTGIEYKF